MALVVAAWTVLVVGFANFDGHHHGKPVLVSVAGWSVMVTAMMLPLAAPDARWLAQRSLTRRRSRTVALHLLGFLAVWVLAGGVIVPAVHAVRAGTSVTAAALVAASVWHVTPIRRRAMRRCGAGRAPAIRGLRADVDCLQAGRRTGQRCLLTCGFAMLAMAATHHLVLMGAVGLLGFSERRPAPNPEDRAGRPAEAIGLAAVALAVVAANLEARYEAIGDLAADLQLVLLTLQYV